MSRAADLVQSLTHKANHAGSVARLDGVASKPWVVGHSIALRAEVVVYFCPVLVLKSSLQLIIEGVIV